MGQKGDENVTTDLSATHFSTTRSSSSSTYSMENKGVVGNDVQQRASNVEVGL
jgi:hypothetical protein